MEHTLSQTNLRQQTNTYQAECRRNRKVDANRVSMFSPRSSSVRRWTTSLLSSMSLAISSRRSSAARRAETRQSSAARSRSASGSEGDDGARRQQRNVPHAGHQALSCRGYPTTGGSRARHRWRRVTARTDHPPTDVGSGSARTSRRMSRRDVVVGRRADHGAARRA